MQPSAREYLWWVVPGELAGMPLPSVSEHRRKKPGAAADEFDDDICFLASKGVRSIVAALDLPIQRKAFEGCGFHYLTLQIPDGEPPTMDQANQVVKFYDSAPRPLVVHCEGGIGRTGTLLALLLVHRGLSGRRAIATVKTAMPPALDIASQVDFILHYAKQAHERLTQ